jgi:hypothetical protein
LQRRALEALDAKSGAAAIGGSGLSAGEVYISGMLRRFDRRWPALSDLRRRGVLLLRSVND